MSRLSLTKNPSAFQNLGSASSELGADLLGSHLRFYMFCQETCLVPCHLFSGHSASFSLTSRWLYRSVPVRLCLGSASVCLGNVSRLHQVSHDIETRPPIHV
jgi:hypothetical protein